MACIAAIKPYCTDIEAAAYVAKAFVAYSPDVYLDRLVSDQALPDVLNAGEAKEAAGYDLRVRTTTWKKKMMVHTRNTNLHKQLKRWKAPKHSENTKSKHTAAAVALQNTGE